MKKTTLKEALAALRQHDQNVEAFWDDPMTEYCGCTDDFSEDFAKKERMILGEILELARKGSKEWKMAFNRLDKYLP